jgi:hypothetical protein
MSFNRPEFLEPVLESLQAQQGDTLAGREIHLFQDGARNRYSGIAYAREADIQESLTVFRAFFPDGKIHYTGDNVGICENFHRAEEYFFKENEFDCAYFFEDDLVLSPAYLQMMETLQRYAARSPRIAYFAAYGDYYAGPEEVRERRRTLITLDHHWAFGLMRRNWLRIRESMSDYYQLILGQDYARRDHRAVYALYEKLGAAPRGSSQDAAKAFACDRLGFWRCRTFVPFARYIGTTGAHMTQASYDQIGFARTVVAQQPLTDLIFPDDRQIDRFLEAQRQLFEEIHATELAGVIATLPKRKLNPMRICTAEDVHAAYHLLLHREVESPAVIEQHAGRKALHNFIRGLMASDEYKSLTARLER